MKPVIVILTKTYSTSLGVIRSLGRAGYEIELFYVTGLKGSSSIVASSRYVKSSYEFPGRKDEEIVDTLIAMYGGRQEQLFLFPTDDYAASLADRYSDRLRETFLMPYADGGKQGRITELMDKALQSELARSCGFPVPKEWIVDLSDEKLTIPEDMVYPCFVKLLVSAKGYKKEIGVCESEDELKGKLRALREADPDRCVLIQEFLAVTGEYSMSGLCLDQEIILPAIVKKIRIAVKERGVTLCGEIVPVDDIAPVKDALYATLKALHFVGMFDAEVMCTKDAIYFGEINLRSGGPNYSYFASGVNLPAMLVEAISIGRAKLPKPITMHKVFLYEKAAWEDYQEHLMTKEELDELYEKADILLLDQKYDPKPGKEFLWYIKTKKIRKIYRWPIRKAKGMAKRVLGLAKKVPGISGVKKLAGVKKLTGVKKLAGLKPASTKNASEAPEPPEEIIPAEGIEIIPMPDWVGYDEICEVVIEAQEANEGVTLSTADVTPEEIEEKVGDDGIMFVALDGDKVVGTMAVTFDKCGKWYVTGKPAMLKFIAVRPDYGRRHIASDLVKACMNWAKENSVGTVLWTTASNNEAAVKTATHNGFVIVDYLKFASVDHPSIRMARWTGSTVPGKAEIKVRYLINRVKVAVKHRV